MRFLVTALCIILTCTCAWAGDYQDSVHADPSNGVSRTSMTSQGYVRGNCAHCHEMHASLINAEPGPENGAPSNFALFAPNFLTSSTHPYSETDNFCFYCHNDAGSAQQVINEDFSKVFGCSTDSNGIFSILDAFNQLSFHNLVDIWSFSKENFSSWFYQDSNPCNACHNPHLVRRNWAAPDDPTRSVLSKPTDHFTLWGITDFMSKYSYTAPYCNGTNREPSGTGVGDGSDMPDYVGFCTACHNTTYSIYSTTLTRNLYSIDWSASGDKHGARNADNGIDIESPFSSAGGYVLSCMDCHEPHGSPNVVLLRRRANGGDLGGTITSLDTYTWGYLCTRCHKDDADAQAGTNEQYKWKYIHHDASDAPYPSPTQCCQCHGQSGMGGGMSKPPINCNYCHYHGGNDSWAASRVSWVSGTNITF